MKQDWSSLLLLGVLTQFVVRKMTKGRLTLAQLVELAKSVGFPDPELAAAVAMAESGGSELALGDGGTSFGLWQIHTPAHPQYNGQSLFERDYNARAAFAISQQGKNWRPWTTFRNGMYLRYYPKKPPPPAPPPETPPSA